MMGKDPGAGSPTGFPTPAQMGATVVASTCRTRSTTAARTTRASASSSAHSLGRVALGFLLAALVAVPLGFLIGMSPLLHRRSTRSSRC